MTTIALAIRGKEIAMAADGRSVCDDLIMTDSAVKIHVVGNLVVGVAGHQRTANIVGTLASAEKDEPQTLNCPYEFAVKMRELMVADGYSTEDPPGPGPASYRQGWLVMNSAMGT